MNKPKHGWGGQRTACGSQVSPATTWLELRSSRLAVSTPLACCLKLFVTCSSLPPWALPLAAFFPPSSVSPLKTQRFLGMRRSPLCILRVHPLPQFQIPSSSFCAHSGSHGLTCSSPYTSSAAQPLTWPVATLSFLVGFPNCNRGSPALVLVIQNLLSS